MIERKTFIGYFDEKNLIQISEYFDGLKKPLKERSDIMTCSVFTCYDMIIIYYESQHRELEPHHLFPDIKSLVKQWPTGKSCFFMPMINIFHYNRPLDENHWKRKSNVSQSTGLIARIKPDMLSSYIYYHYILQETTVKIREKYGAIFLFGDILFFYRELPSENEYSSYEGKINGAIPENWGLLMKTHFSFWENCEEPWKQMKKLI